MPVSTTQPSNTEPRPNRTRTSSTPAVSRYVPRPGWQDDAACRLMPHSVFYGYDDLPMSANEVRAAMRICNECPVQPDCLATALINNERHGVWGGRSKNDRARAMKEAHFNVERAMAMLGIKALVVSARKFVGR
jgi:WhiB family redox-sensing transcriptional regulator